MKKISKPTGEMPEVYRVNLDTEAVTETQSVEKTSVPLASVHNYNLKKLKSFKAIRRKYKMNNQLSVFLNDINVVLENYKPTDHQLDNELLLHILNIAEKFFIYGSKEEREEMKTGAVNLLMTKYYRDDPEILDLMKASVWHKVTKSNLAKRLLRRLSNYFFFK